MKQRYQNTELKLGDNADQLSGQQKAVLLMICMGLSDKLIARAMGRSPETVKSHVKILFIIFGVDSRAGLVREALCHGVVMPMAGLLLACLLMQSVADQRAVRHSRGQSMARTRTEQTAQQEVTA